MLVHDLKTNFTPLRRGTISTEISYGYQEIPDSNDAHFHQVRLYHKQENMIDAARIRKAIIDDINERTDERILSGFVWQGKQVWLSQENQRNFSEAHRMAQAQPELVLPVTFKIGEGEDGTPTYHTFSDFDELNDFYVSAFAHINQCLQEGWTEKDGVDFSVYDEEIEEKSEE